MRVDSPEIPTELREAMKALKIRPVLFQYFFLYLFTLQIHCERNFKYPKSCHSQGVLGSIDKGWTWRITKTDGITCTWFNAVCRGYARVGTSSECFWTGNARSAILFQRSGYGFDSCIHDGDPRQIEAESVFRDIPDFELESVSVVASLEKNLEGVCRPLKVCILFFDTLVAHRIGDQFTSKSSDPLSPREYDSILWTNYCQNHRRQGSNLHITGRVCNFYHCPDSLFSIASMAFRVFFDSLNKQASALMVSVEVISNLILPFKTPSPDLFPLPAFQDALQQLVMRT